MNQTSAAISQPTVLRLALTCDLAEVQGAARAAHDFLAAQGWGADDLMNFDLALVEACNNAVKYADDPGRTQPVGLEIVSAPDRVEFRVADHTPGFDWPEKIELPSRDSERGRGLYLINSVMDDAGYFRGRKSNLLVMRKSRAAATRKPDVPNRKLAENERDIGGLVEELSSCYESLSAIFRYSSEQGKTADFDEFARRLLHDLLQIVAADWFILRLAPKGESRLVVFAASEPALNLEPLPLPPPERTAASTETEAALSRETVWFDLRDPPFAETPLARVKATSAGLSHPIQMGDQLLGTLTLGKAAAGGPSPARSGLMFTAGQTNVIGTFADFLAIQLANARFRDEQLGRELVAHELEIAKNIQRSLLPVTLPQLPGFHLAAFCRSAREVGGDFYDVLEINGHSLLLVIADVMGKGIPAAMFAAVLRTLLRASPELTAQPGELLARANRLLFPDLSAVDMFITAQIAHVDAVTRRLTLANAGHCPLAVATPEGVRAVSPKGRPLGIAADSIFREETVALPPHCRVLLYTDGLTETVNAQDEEFGEQRLLDWLQGATGRDPAGLQEELAGTLKEFLSNTALNDDQTFLILAG